MSNEAAPFACRLLTVILMTSLANACGGSATPPAGPSSPSPSAASFSLSCTAPSAKLGWSGSVTVACTVASMGGFSGDVAISCTGAPNGVICEHQPPSVRLTANGAEAVSVRIRFTPEVPAGTHAVTVMGTMNALRQQASIALEKTAETVIAACPSLEDLDVIDRDLRLQFESDPSAGIFVCTSADGSRNLTRLQERAYQALIMLRRLSFSAPLPWTPDSPYEWMIRAIRAIRFRSDIQLSFCCSPADTINIQTNNLGVLQFNDFRWLSTLMLLFVHEARHNQGFPHNCADRIRDRTIADLGGWGVQYHLGVWMAERTDPPFVLAGTRNTIRQDAQNLCPARFCDQGSCP